jgi:hypothetical protein
MNSEFESRQDTSPTLSSIFAEQFYNVLYYIFVVYVLEILAIAVTTYGIIFFINYKKKSAANVSFRHV